MSKKIETVTVRGQSITASTFTADFKTVKSAAATLGRLLEGAGKQAALFDNLDWINRLFEDGSPLVKKDGELSEQGKKAKAYIVHHVPSVKIEKDKEKGAFKAAYTKNKKTRGTFITGVDDEGNAVYTDDGKNDFYFSFDQWVNKGKKASAPKAPKASKVANTIDKTLEDWENLEGAAEEFAALELAARRIMEAASARKAALVAEMSQGVDADAALQSGTAKPQSSKRADTDREEHAATA